MTLGALRRLRPLIRRHGTKDQRVAYNAAVSAAKGQRFDTCDAKYGYGVAARSAVQARGFETMARQFLGRNPLEVRLQTPSGLLG